MAYDLLIKNGRVIDGSGIPAFRGDVGIKGGKIVEIGKLSGAATRTIDAEGRAVAPALSTITAITMRRSPGTRSAPSRRSTARLP
jgi:N-acyl-D-aspartate/D-glutamate deacylase